MSFFVSLPHLLFLLFLFFLVVVLFHVQYDKMHLHSVLILVINMNVARDVQASRTVLWFSLRDAFYNSILAHLLPSVECFITTDVLRCHGRKWKRHLKESIWHLYSFVCHSLEKRAGSLCILLSCSPPPVLSASLSSQCPFALSRGIITSLVNISYTSIPPLSFTWQIPALICPQAQEINKTRPSEKPGQLGLPGWRFFLPEAMQIPYATIGDRAAFHKIRSLKMYFFFWNSVRCLFDRMFLKFFCLLKPTTIPFYFLLSLLGLRDKKARLSTSEESKRRYGDVTAAWIIHA